MFNMIYVQLSEKYDRYDFESSTLLQTDTWKSKEYVSHIKLYDISIEVNQLDLF